MLKRQGLGLLLAVVAGIATTVASYFPVLEFSSNMHDRSVEAAMTSVFFYGPVGAVLGFIAGVILGGRPRPGAGEPG